MARLEEFQGCCGGVPFRLSCEATYFGFLLQRDLKDQGNKCELVAPSRFARRAGKSVKTSRIDATELAQSYANRLLTIVTSTDAQVEHNRDLLRSRPTGAKINTVGRRERSNGVLQG